MIRGLAGIEEDIDATGVGIGMQRLAALGCATVLGTLKLTARRRSKPFDDGEDRLDLCPARRRDRAEGRKAEEEEVLPTGRG